MTRFLLIRHAVTNATDKRLVGRSAGVRLNEQGRVQAQVLAERLSTAPIAAIYSSPLERTLETAEPMVRLLGIDAVPCEDFLEIEFGEWTDAAFDQLSGQLSFQRFNNFRSCSRIPGGEFMLQAQSRMVIGLDRLRARHPQQTVAVFSHGDMIKAAIAYYAGIPLDLFKRIEISPASISVVEIDDDTVRLLTVNDTGTVPV
ncbi:MAG TPA: histidine phosphatase family protein [Pseudoxanthomonas sp.]|nr:histidine phosphatase family protein [Pseudoxanthomonas sp.]